MKEWLVEVFSEPGYRPPMISHTLFDCIPEPHVADGTLDKIIHNEVPKFQDILLTGLVQTRPSERMGEQILGTGPPLSMNGNPKNPIERTELAFQSKSDSSTLRMVLTVEYRNFARVWYKAQLPHTLLER
eukprot:3557921-Rhodomonas_salina.1